MTERRRRAVALPVVAIGLALVTVSACSDDDRAERTAAGVCAALGPAETLVELARGFDPTDVPRALNRLEAMEVELVRIHDVAPDELREPLDAELTYVRALADALEQVDPDDPAAVADAVNALRDEAAAASRASGDLEAFQDANCGTTTVAPVG